MYIPDLMTERGQFIISLYLVLIGIVEPAIVITQQVHQSNKTVDGFIFWVFNPTLLT